MPDEIPVGCQVCAGRGVRLGGDACGLRRRRASPPASVRQGDLRRKAGAGWQIVFEPDAVAGNKGPAGFAESATANTTPRRPAKARWADRMWPASLGWTANPVAPARSTRYSIPTKRKSTWAKVPRLRISRFRIGSHRSQTQHRAAALVHQDAPTYLASRFPRRRINPNVAPLTQNVPGRTDRAKAMFPTFPASHRWTKVSVAGKLSTGKHQIRILVSFRSATLSFFLQGVSVCHAKLSLWLSCWL